MKTGQTVTHTMLTKTYDLYWPFVISSLIKQLPREGKGVRKYECLADLPDKAKYTAMKNERYTTTVEDLVSVAMGEVESLGEEMQEWYDNLPEGFQNSERGERVQEAADALSGIDIPDIDESFTDLTTICYPTLDAGSRAKRATQAADYLRAAAEAIREFVDGVEDEEKRDDYDTTVADDLENAADELEAVEFPGMFG